MLEQIYFVSQITAAIFVVASILFLAMSVRQNSRLLEQTMAEERRTALNTLFDRLATDRDFADFHMRAGKDFENLDEVDRYRASWLARRNLRAQMHTIQARQNGFISDIEWQEMRQGLRFAGARKNVVELWQQLKSTYPVELQKIYEEMIGLEKSKG